MVNRVDSTLGTIRNINQSSNEINKRFERLSSGKRINRAADDAAGLAIADQLEATARELQTAERNVNDGFSITSIQEGALGQITDLQTRRAELSEQAANGTLSDAQRSTLNQEFQALGQEIQRITGSTEFNGVNVFGTDTTFQVGTENDPNSQITAPAISVSSFQTGGDILSQASARSSLDSISSDIQNIAATRGRIGSITSRLDEARKNIESTVVQSKAAESRIRDADIADETSKLTSARILQQSGVAVLAQANLDKGRVLKLLQ